MMGVNECDRKNLIDWLINEKGFDKETAKDWVYFYYPKGYYPRQKSYGVKK